MKNNGLSRTVGSARAPKLAGCMSSIPGRVIPDVAEQLHCSLHVKELKVTTTELEGQAGN